MTLNHMSNGHEIVVAYDGAPASDAALSLGGLLARRCSASLTVVSVYAAEPAFHAHTAHLRLVLAAEADDNLERAERRLPYGLHAELRAVRSHSVPNALLDLAANDDVDLIVVGGKAERGTHTSLTGSVAERLVAAGPRCAVAVVAKTAGSRVDAALRVIGVAYDGSREADAALAEGERLALAAGGTLHVIGVLEPASWRTAGLPALAGFAEPEGQARERLNDALERAIAEVAPDVCALSIVATGAPAAELARQGTDLDLLVVGSRGYGPITHASLGSVSTALLRSLPCPVLVVPRPPLEVVSSGAALVSAVGPLGGRGPLAFGPRAGSRSPAPS